MSFFRKRLKSFACALRGVGVLIRSQPHARIHLAATLAVLVSGLALGLDPVEWCLLILAIIVVWAAEGMNTAIEFLADALHPDHHPLIGKAKDVASAAVLLAAAGAAIIGALILGRHLLAFFCV